MVAAPGADIIFLTPPVGVPDTVDPQLASTLCRAAARGGLIVAVDASVFTLAWAGLLDGRAATTHPSLADRFRARFPQVDLRTTESYVEDGPFLTAASTSATAVLSLRLLAGEPHASGAPAAAPLATGRQATTDDAIADLLRWIDDHLDRELSLTELARRSYLSTRTLSRRFSAATGTTPYAWILQRRSDLARRLLEQQPDLSVEEVARRTGFGNAAVLRRHFCRTFGRTPTQHRWEHRRG